MPQRLTETAGEEGQPLDVHGRRLIDCYEQLVGILRNRLGQNHAHLFAQPRAAASGSIAWYTPLAGSVVRADALPPEERQRLQERAQRILGDVQGVAADIQSEGAAGQMIADMLRAAAELAPGAPLFSVDGKPVFVLWGHRSTAAPVAAASPPSISHPAPGSAPPIGATSRPVSIAPSSQSAPHVAVPANSQGSTIPPNIARESDPAARNRRRTRLLAACAAVVVLLALLWGLRQFSFGDRETGASGGNLDTQIAQVESRNRVLVAEIAQMKEKSKAPAVKCVPEPKKKK